MGPDEIFWGLPKALYYEEFIKIYNLGELNSVPNIYIGLFFSFCTTAFYRIIILAHATVQSTCIQRGTLPACTAS